MNKDLQDKVEKLKETAEQESKRVAKLMEHSWIAKTEWRKTDVEKKYEKLDNFLSSTVICSRGRPVETLIGAVKDHLEGLELKAKENTGIKNLRSAMARKTEELVKAREEK